MAIQGFRHTENFVQDGRPLHWRATVLMLYPNDDAPLYALTSAMKSEAVDDPEYNWWEKPMQTRRVALANDLTTTGGSVTIDVESDALTFKNGDILLVEETGELLLVNTDPVADDEITVSREYGSVAATAVDFDGAAVNPNLLLIGSAYEEGSDAPSGRAYDPAKRFNFTQIFRNTFEHTRTAAKTRLRTGDDVKEAKRETLELHSRDIEMAFLLGNRRETTRNGRPLRMTGGIRSFIADDNNLSAQSGQLDMDTLDEWMERFFAYGSSQKLAFLGNRAMTAINQAVRKNTSYQIFANEKEYGMKVSRIISPHGELVLKRHPLFNQVGGATGTQTYYGLNSSMVVLDAKELRYRYFKGDDTRYESKLQDNGIDGEKSGFLTEAGLEVWHGDSTHFWCEGLNAGIADS